MESTFPRAPGRGRSRFSKALPGVPLPPEPPAPPPITKDKPQMLPSTPMSLRYTLPPIPKESPPLPTSKTSTSVMAIPRRPVGGAAPREYTKTPSIPSVSSVSSDAESPVFSRSLSSGTSKTKDSLSDPETPPLPPKDTQTQQQTPQSTLASPASGFQTSPVRPEIWRRRSVKSDRSIVVPELKLNKSNGSTASLPRQPPRDLPAVPSQLPRSQARKPIPARPPPPQPDFGGMGQKLSKLGNKKRGSSDSTEDGKPQPYPPFQNKRLPTPEYLRTDKQQQPIPTVLSPTSPETPPHDDPPVIPQKSESRSASQTTVVPDGVLANTTNRPNLFSSHSRDTSDRTLKPDLVSSHSRDTSETLTTPNLLSSHSRDTTETLTITSEPQVMRSPQPQKAYAAAKILTPQPSPPSSTDQHAPQVSSLSTSKSPPLTSPPSASKSPEHLALPSPADKLNIHFPKPTITLAPGTIMQGPELGIVHYECYQNHALMRNSKNILYPTACMVCRKKEPGPRWRCTWCCLSACGACMQALTSVPGRDLRIAVERIAKRGETGHQSQKSSGSGVGHGQRNSGSGLGHGSGSGSWGGR